jgi:hypothetical protein
MAAGGFKVFTTGEVLTSADTNNFLMQGVLVFDDATARDAAITAPVEGQFAYLKDTDVTTYYTSSAWANLDTTGMTNPMTTTADIIYSSSGSTPARLGIGTAGQVLQVNSGATAPEWAAAAGGGKVVQIVSATYATTFTSSSSTFADTGLTATITPTSASNNILVFVNQNGCGKAANNTGINLRLLRGGTNIIDFGRLDADDGGSNTNRIGSISTAYLDSPATTSATTYKTQAASNGNNSVIILQESSGGVFATSTILLMEVTP